MPAIDTLPSGMKVYRYSELAKEEVDSLLQKHGAEDCVTDALHAARQDLSERRGVLSVRAHTVEVWRARLLGMVNVCPPARRGRGDERNFCGQNSGQRSGGFSSLRTALKFAQR